MVRNSAQTPYAPSAVHCDLKRSDRNKSRFIAAVCIFAAILISIAGIAWSADQAIAKEKNEETADVTISAAGDCTLGVDSRYNSIFNSYYARYGSAYFLKNAKNVFAKDDITIVNFEGTLTSARKRANKTFTFKGPSKYVDILKKGSVEVVNLANNHSKDFLSRGFSDTKKTLKKNNIPYSYKTTIAYKTVKGVKVAFLGFTNVGESLTKKNISTGISNAKKKGAKIIVVSMHWGIERDYYPNSTEKALGRYAIRCGASLVLGHHPHVLQGIEKYKGRYIVYSLGNFCFGGNSNPSDKDTMIFQQTFTVKNGKLTNKNNAKVIPCSLSGRSYTNTFKPKILKGSEKSRVMNKIRMLSKGKNIRISKSGALG